jgi:hypothetical protein
LRRHRFLVGADGRHDLEGVGHGHYARRQRYLVAREGERVARAVVVLMVLLDGQAPLTEPGRQRANEASALQRVLTDDLPFLVRGLARLVQDVGVHRQLAHVMEEGRPAKPVLVGGREVHVVGDHVREGSDPF